MSRSSSLRAALASVSTRASFCWVRVSSSWARQSVVEVFLFADAADELVEAAGHRHLWEAAVSRFFIPGDF